MKGKERTVMFGIDGVPYSLMDTLARTGVMPNLDALRASGSFVPMRSSIPDISSVSWSSIITGANPGEHGVFGFTHLIPGTYTLSFPNFDSLRAPPFWAREGDGRTYVVINVPFTYPARELRGFLVSGFVALDMDRAVTPPAYLGRLQELGYQIDVDAKKAEMSKGLFLRDLFATLEARARAMRMLWDDIDWDTFVFTVTGSDRIGHVMWDAYEDPGHPHHGDFLEFFRRVDALIGEVQGRMGDQDRLLMLSDHGMEPIQWRVNVNTVLAEEGLLRLGEEHQRGLRNILPGSSAFSMEPARVHVNLEGLYPRGSVDPGDRESVAAQVAEAFRRLAHEGRPVIEEVHLAEDIYHGPHMEQAPDLVLMPARGFSLHSNTAPRPVLERDRLAGKHTPEAFLLVGENDAGVAPPPDPTVEDVVPLLLKLQGDPYHGTA